jgi:hypothetical protein
LNSCPQGIEKLFADIRQEGHFILSNTQRKRVDALLGESDSLRIFLRQNLVASQRCDLTASEIITKYTAYAVNAGWNPIPIGIAQRQLDDLMLELFSVPRG